MYIIVKYIIIQRKQNILYIFKMYLSVINTISSKYNRNRDYGVGDFKATKLILVYNKRTVL